jgi:hypothetical protein
MKRARAGKRFFYAMGQQDSARNNWYGSTGVKGFWRLPDWARDAYMGGFFGW